MRAENDLQCDILLPLLESILVPYVIIILYMTDTIYGVYSLFYTFDAVPVQYSGRACGRYVLPAIFCVTIIRWYDASDLGPDDLFIFDDVIIVLDDVCIGNSVVRWRRGTVWRIQVTTCRCSDAILCRYIDQWRKCRYALLLLKYRDTLFDICRCITYIWLHYLMIFSERGVGAVGGYLVFITFMGIHLENALQWRVLLWLFCITILLEKCRVHHLMEQLWSRAAVVILPATIAVHSAVDDDGGMVCLLLPLLEMIVRDGTIAYVAVAVMMPLTAWSDADGYVSGDGTCLEILFTVQCRSGAYLHCYYHVITWCSASIHQCGERYWCSTVLPLY